MNQHKKSWYKRVWVWILIVIAFFIVVGTLSGGSTTQTPAGTQDTNSATNTGSNESEQPQAWNGQAAYDKVSNGMTKAEVEAATGKKSESCTTMEDPTFGKTEICQYGNVFIDKVVISVTYQQDKVESKSKHEY